MKRQAILALAVVLLSGASPAQACMGPLSHHLLNAVPDNTPAGAFAIRVHFTNRDPSRWQRGMPIRTRQDRIFVGMARRLDRPSAPAFPVYALASSCEPDFMPGPQPLDRQGVLVGQFDQLNGRHVFVALARRGSGHWEAFNRP